MTSDAYRRFQDSTKLSYDDWKEGTPYDLAALDEMTADERKLVEKELSEKDSLDWRDIEALRRIGTSSAKKRVKRAGYAQSDGASVEAFKDDIAEGWTPGQEIRFIRKLREARHMAGMFDRLFTIAEQHPTQGVRDALYALATKGHEDVRYAYGAFLLYLNGHADEWYGFGPDRPRLLDLLHGDDEARAAAAAWLKEKVENPVVKAK